MRTRYFVHLLLLSSAALSSAEAQGILGQISGAVTDSAGSRIVGAVVQCSNDLTKQIRTFTSDSSGSFLFTDLVPGDYSVRITYPGFKSYLQPAINVSPQEKVALHDIALEVGDVNSTVTIQAETAHVATDSSDRSILVNTTQIENTPIRGRDFIALLQTLPGVVDLNNHDVPGYNANMPTVNGGQTGQLLFTLDGIVSQNSGAPQNSGYLAPSVDAIAEVQVMVSNYSAQYGSRGGGQVNVVIKNGTDQFHGSAYFFLRNEALNANEYFNNLAAAAKPLYRYLNPGGTFGGPLLIPGTNFNKSRTKLFFFFSEDYLRYVNPAGLSEYTMPTALERAGNFSQTTTTTGKLIPIKDPATGAPFPGNIIPASRESPAGYALLNLFPLPFTTDPSGQRQYNSIYQFNLNDQHEDRILRIDYNVSSSTQAFVRLLNDYQSERGIGAHFGASGLWGQLPTSWGIPSAGAVATVIHAFRPNLINELTVGINHTHQVVSVTPTDLATNQLPALKGPGGAPVVLPKIFQNNDALNLIPNISFGTQNAQSAGQTVTNAPPFGYDNRFPFNGTDQSTNFIDNVSWVKNGHSLKFGFYFERTSRNVSVYETDGPMGKYWFGSDTADSFDTGYAYSNLFLGTVQAYGEDNVKFINHARYNQFEWYGQDSWKISRRVTLDLGVRFQYPGALSSLGATLGVFDGSTYNVNQSGQLLFPAQVNGQNVSINPATGAVYQLARAGFFDPASYPANGSPYSGMVQKKNQIFNNPGLAVGPRVGFAWDILGNGKMALRGGFGIFYDRAMNVDVTAATSAGVGPVTAPPAFQTPTYYNTTIAQLSNAQGFLGPQSVFQGTSFKNPATYNWSLGVQRDLGRGLILDIAYVGNVVHHTFQQVDANGVAPYTVWTPTGGANPAYLDPTSGGKAFYTANLLRPTTGYASILDTCSCGEANYNSLQTQVNKRFGRRWQFGSNWTWSKTMSYGTRSPWTPDRLQYAEVSGDRPQAVSVNYSYRIPDGSRFWKNQFTEVVLDGWHINGITKFLSGNPLTVTCTAASAPIGYWTGTPTGGIPFRCQMSSSNIFLPSGSPLPANAPTGRYYPINVANFSLPPATSLGIGNTPPTLFFGPGYERFDFTLFKDIRLGKESRVLELRAEAYNVFNHFNPGNPNTSLTLNYASGANTNAAFGTITTAAGQARHFALAMKFRF